MVYWPGITPRVHAARDQLHWLARVVLMCGMTGMCACGRAPMLRIHFIDAGYGDAILLHDGSGHALLVDGGYGANETDQGRQTVVPYLQANGIMRLDAMFCTHSHPDHAGGLVDVVRALPVTQFIRPAWGQTNAYTAALGELCAARNIPVSIAGRGAEWKWGDVHITALHPPAGGADVVDEPCDLNANSLALEVRFGRARVLLLADITTPVLRELHAAGLLSPAVLVKIPHHGHRDAYDEGIVRALAPQHAVLTIGANPYGAPAPDVIRGYEALCTLWRTDRDGTITAEVSAGGSVIVGARKGKEDGSARSGQRHTTK